ncbi:MAG: Ni/Fe hydrogenase subunit alpha [Candidatus Eisenbacteria bacterium]|uniref:Ni/Fe hydrogenase subunit alpha n=1 Tax=Eiseniibacteriota bacterium TaxID=2212470 RepID=A0A948RX26_UNCEI|nr:Ni/Fe hydrogenase subunit alpha [Candidatus Eisenbacteria bacterium]MBU1947395.1 Ni/Fe hydrogenase subunit alpha [Candidatus Eisenbacteria bacterium]MBU2692076.1 Ni/Fe hydrogenase subunit alpha [Candidatus Eisenbacteria bacterium]
MSQNLEIKVKHLTRVEGHGNIVVNMLEGVLEKAQLDIVEAPRYFEAMLKGRSFHEAAIITSRICGICSLGHQMTSFKTTEEALGLEISEQTIALRKILIHGATIQSNILHSLFLAAPDFLKVGSVFPLIGTHPEVVKAALRMKGLANDISSVIAGRAVHPISCVPGGFTKLPDAAQLAELKGRLEKEMIPDLTFAAEVLTSLASEIPGFTRDTEYISLRSDDDYALYDGDICSSDTGRVPDSEYRSMTNEFIVPHSTAKHSRANRSSFMVGALARWNNNHDRLCPEAMAVAEKLGLKAPCTNPFMNTIAQVVESVHCAIDAIRLIDSLLTKGIKPELPNQKPTRYGSGVGATEVPRGILYHEYAYDRQGRIMSANCVIPTSQNLANIDDDMKKIVPEICDRPKKEIIHGLEMLVRAYDPCISCSVHMLDVEFVE